MHAWPTGVMLECKRIAPAPGTTVSAERGTETCLLTPEKLRSAELGEVSTLCQGSSNDNRKKGLQGPSC